MCEQCAACKPGMKESEPLLCFKDFREAAVHRMTEISNEDYIRCTRPLSPWAQVSGWNLYNNFRDFMHLVYLGTARDLIASDIKLLLLNRCLGQQREPADQKLWRLSEDMHRQCRNAGLKMRKRTLTLANCGLDQPQFAEMGSMFKAAHIKCMLWYFAKKMEEVADEYPLGQDVAACNWTLVRAINIFDAGGLLLSPDDASQAAGLPNYSTVSFVL